MAVTTWLLPVVPGKGVDDHLPEGFMAVAGSSYNGIAYRCGGRRLDVTACIWWVNIAGEDVCCSQWTANECL